MRDLNRAQRIEQAMFLASLADKAKERAAAIRAELETEAREELARTGTAPTWRIPSGGTVPLALTQDAIEICDEPSYLRYVANRYPEHVETIHRVRPAFDKTFREAAAKRGAALDDEGTVIGGCLFRKGGEPKGISIRPGPVAKEAALELAGAIVDSLLKYELEVPGE